MAIRLRRVEGFGLVALCAARSVEKPGDVYLDDEVHHALSDKFAQDFSSMGFLTYTPARLQGWAIREAEESNNPNRDDWDATFGAGR